MQCFSSINSDSCAIRCRIVRSALPRSGPGTWNTSIGHRRGSRSRRRGCDQPPGWSCRPPPLPGSPRVGRSPGVWLFQPRFSEPLAIAPPPCGSVRAGKSPRQDRLPRCGTYYSKSPRQAPQPRGNAPIRGKFPSVGEPSGPRGGAGSGLPSGAGAAIGVHAKPWLR
jgi:hypothetical protein